MPTPHNTIHRFDDRVEHYVSARPSYPAEAAQAMLRGLGWPSMLTVADVGAGTGIMARLIADAGPMVVAVEPNEKMRAGAEPHERVVWQDRSAEATGLKDGSVDLVVCAQAFHWFDRPAALAEFKRVLRSVGRLALVWNEVDTNDPLGAVYRRVVDDAAEDDAPRRRHAIGADPFEGDELFCDVRREEFAYEQVLTVDGLIGRAMSASYAPKSGPGHVEMVAALREAHGDWVDRHSVPGEETARCAEIHRKRTGTECRGTRKRTGTECRGTRETAVLRYRTAVWMAEPRRVDEIDLKIRRGE